MRSKIDAQLTCIPPNGTIPTVSISTQDSCRCPDLISQLEGTNQYRNPPSYLYKVHSVTQVSSLFSFNSIPRVTFPPFPVGYLSLAFVSNLVKNSLPSDFFNFFKILFIYPLRSILFIYVQIFVLDAKISLLVIFMILKIPMLTFNSREEKI